MSSFHWQEAVWLLLAEVAVHSVVVVGRRIKVENEAQGAWQRQNNVQALCGVGQGDSRRWYTLHELKALDLSACY